MLFSRPLSSVITACGIPLLKKKKSVEGGSPELGSSQGIYMKILKNPFF